MQDFSSLNSLPLLRGGRKTKNKKMKQKIECLSALFRVHFAESS